MQLRPYQLAAIDAVRARFAAGDRSTLAVLATGLGKAVIAADIARRAAQNHRRTLLFVHHEELVEQLAGKLRTLDLSVGVEMAAHRAAPDAQCVVASVPTLRGDRLSAFDPHAFDLLIADEAHHATAASWRSIPAHFPLARLLGFSATPDRADGTPLADVFQSVAYRYELADAIRDEWLCPLLARRVVIDGVDLSNIATRCGDLAQEALAAVMEHARAVHGVVIPLLELVDARPTILFAASVAHAYQLAQAINERRPTTAARVIHGALPRDQRRAALAAYNAGAIQFLVNVDVLSEGFDAPHTACIALARPTKSRARYVQRIGRGTRKHHTKRDCLLLDFTGQAGKHALCGPGDALAGDVLPTDIRAQLEAALAADTRDPVSALARARWDAEQNRIAAARAAFVRFHTEHVDPFFGADPDPTSAVDDGAPADAAQLAELAEAGITNPPPALTRAQAQRILDRLTARGLAGLCTYAQARRIAPSGIDTRTLSAQRARQLLAILRRHGFRPWALHDQPEAQTEAARAYRAARAIALRAEKQAKAARAKARQARATERVA